MLEAYDHDVKTLLIAWPKGSPPKCTILVKLHKICPTNWEINLLTHFILILSAKNQLLILHIFLAYMLVQPGPMADAYQILKKATCVKHSKELINRNCQNFAKGENNNFKINKWEIWCIWASKLVFGMEALYQLLIKM